MRQRASRRPRRPDGSVWVRTYPLTMPRDHVEPAHAHDWDQLTYAASGVLRVATSDASWIVPPHCAVWIPASVTHTEYLFGPVSMRTLYLVEGAAAALPRSCQTVNVSSLTRELILHVCRIGALDRRVPSHARLIGVLLDQLSSVSRIPLQLPMPRDSRAVRFASLVERSPDARASVGALARQSGASRRTIERLFLAETKMSAGEWRRRLRLLHAVRMLSEGAPVTTASLATGYASVSAFIAVFRKTFGTTPGRYVTATDRSGR
jgi:AraC-like DNA-binding protein